MHAAINAAAALPTSVGATGMSGGRCHGTWACVGLTEKKFGVAAAYAGSMQKGKGGGLASAPHCGMNSHERTGVGVSLNQEVRREKGDTYRWTV